MSILLVTGLCAAQSTTGGPLELTGEIVMGAAFDPYCPNSGIQADRATRVKLSIQNPTQQRVTVPQLLGTFYDGTGSALYTNRQATTVKPGETQEVYLYFNNAGRVLISSVLITAIYTESGKNYQNQVAVTPAGIQR